MDGWVRRATVNGVSKELDTVDLLIWDSNYPSFTSIDFFFIFQLRWISFKLCNYIKIYPTNNYNNLLCRGTLCESEVAQSCPTLCGPMDSNLPDFSLHGIFQAGVLEWVAISFSKGSSQPRDPIHIAASHFIFWATREAWRLINHCPFLPWRNSI